MFFSIVISSNRSSERGREFSCLAIILLMATMPMTTMTDGMGKWSTGGKNSATMVVVLWIMTTCYESSGALPYVTGQHTTHLPHTTYGAHMCYQHLSTQNHLHYYDDALISRAAGGGERKHEKREQSTLEEAWTRLGRCQQRNLIRYIVSTIIDAVVTIFSITVASLFPFRLTPGRPVRCSSGGNNRNTTVGGRQAWPRAYPPPKKRIEYVSSLVCGGLQNKIASTSLGYRTYEARTPRQLHITTKQKLGETHSTSSERLTAL